MPEIQVVEAKSEAAWGSPTRLKSILNDTSRSEVAEQPLQKSGTLCKEKAPELTPGIERG